VLHTIISVFATAQGLSNVQECKDAGITVAACLNEQENKKALIYDGILAAQLQVLPEELGNKSFSFKFTNDGYGDIGYNILNFRRNLTTNSFVYNKVGGPRLGMMGRLGYLH
jgi:hypothetical protein